MPQVIEASAFVSSLGVNTHLDYNTTEYWNLPAVENAMRYLGLTNMRDNAGANLAWYPNYATAAKDGFHFDFVVPNGSGGGAVQSPAAIASWLSSFEAAHPGSIVAIEGPNEVNFTPVAYGGQTGYAGSVAYETALYSALKSTPNLAGIPSLNLSLGVDNFAAFAPLGNMAAEADQGVAHIYIPWGDQPNVSFFTQLSWAQTVTPGKPMAITETGYATYQSDSALSVSEPVQAKMILNLAMDAAKAGVASTYFYELADVTAFGGSYGSYGLFRADWTPKPAATALHNLTTILTTSAGETPSAAPSYTVTGLTGYNASQTFHEVNGTYDIVVWREPDIWDQTNHVEIQASPQTATIHLAQAVAGYSVYDPLTGSTAIAAGGPGDTINLQITDHPLIIELHGSATVSNPTTPTTPTTSTGTSASDTLTGADGRPNAIFGGDGADSITGGSAFNQVNGNKGDDTIMGKSAVGDWLLGGQGDDLIDASASSGHNIVNGNLGADTIMGGSGGDTLRGGQGDDVIHAGGGSNWISGDLGNNRIYGGQGGDVFHAGAGHDAVSGWQAGDHVLVDAGVTFTVDQVNADVRILFSSGGEMDLLNTQATSLPAGWIVSA